MIALVCMRISEPFNNDAFNVINLCTGFFSLHRLTDLSYCKVMYPYHTHKLAANYMLNRKKCIDCLLNRIQDGGSTFIFPFARL